MTENPEIGVFVHIPNPAGFFVQPDRGGGAVVSVPVSHARIHVFFAAPNFPISPCPLKHFGNQQSGTDFGKVKPRCGRQRDRRGRIPITGSFVGRPRLSLCCAFPSFCGLARPKSLAKNVENPPMDTETKVIAGQCHCGAVRFEASLSDGFNTIRRCTCSYCRMRGAVAVSSSPAKTS